MSNKKEKPAPREFWILKDQYSNRALTREHGEKYGDDVNGEPHSAWTHIIEYSAYLTEKKRAEYWKSEVDKLITENPRLLRDEKYAQLKADAEKLVTALEQYHDGENTPVAHEALKAWEEKHGK